MSTVNELITEQVTSFADSFTVSGTYAQIDIDEWTVTGSGLGGVHNLSSTDISSAQAEVDAWLLSNDHKRVSVWYGSGQNNCVVAF